MAKTVKTAVSLPAAVYRKAETARKKQRQSRSGLYAAALETYLAALEVREQEGRYAAGYKATPEDLAEIAVGVEASLPALGNEAW
jgi:metal-responsive CopG/Arc/MetJ family transcriptional regulator